MNATKLPEGLWLARWSSWEILLTGHHGQWHATLTMVANRQFDRVPLHLESQPYNTALEAAKWAADQLTQRGQVVLLLGGSRIKTLVDMLRFEPLVA